jgi:hypothetical protein
MFDCMANSGSVSGSLTLADSGVCIDLNHNRNDLTPDLIIPRHLFSPFSIDSNVAAPPGTVDEAAASRWVAAHAESKVSSQIRPRRVATCRSFL